MLLNALIFQVSFSKQYPQLNSDIYSSASKVQFPPVNKWLGNFDLSALKNSYKVNQRFALRSSRIGRYKREIRNDVSHEKSASNETIIFKSLFPQAKLPSLSTLPFVQLLTQLVSTSTTNTVTDWRKNYQKLMEVRQNSKRDLNQPENRSKFFRQILRDQNGKLPPGKANAFNEDLSFLLKLAEEFNVSSVRFFNVIFCF